jgi:hypothetical protein
MILGWFHRASVEGVSEEGQFWDGRISSTSLFLREGVISFFQGVQDVLP